MKNPLKWLTQAPTQVRRPLVWVCHAILIFCSLWFSFLLRFDFNLPRSYFRVFLLAIPIWIISKSIVFRLLRLDRGLSIGFSVTDVPMVLTGNLIASGACFSVAVTAGLRLPFSVFCLDGVLCLFLYIALRGSVPFLLGREWLLKAPGDVRTKNILIYGAGQAGIILMREIWHNPGLRYRVCGFIDDAREKKGLRVAGIRVLGDGSSMSAAVHRLGIETILIAIPSATGLQMSEILKRCHNCGVECKTVPGLAEMITNVGLARQMREVAVEDLLGRSPVVLMTDQIRQLVENQTVLVTGAGGSIGSELCRQIARFAPSRLVGFEIAESALFEIQRQISHYFPSVHFYSEIGNIQNGARLAEVFRRHRPSVVFHAAAYKHVPMMEEHAFEAVENNVLGSYNVARASIKAGVRTFVLISTDKAVNPTNIMGATKRTMELLLLSMQSETKFVAVRFGNVLGSNGSVIPIFKKQIATGGPVTVTHPEMTRFFMTIPEACQLVLQAATIADGGQICVLDMGEPVKILDLAKNLILLSGLQPGKDIQIKFSGVRPGEKLNEELASDLGACRRTVHDKIMIYEGVGTLSASIDAGAWIEEVAEICRRRDSARLLCALKAVTSDYNPSLQILKRALQSEAEPTTASTASALMPGFSELPNGLVQVQ